MNISQVLYQSFIEAPQKAAVYLLFNDRSDQKLTHQELFQKAAAVTSALNQANVRPGEVVILIQDHGKDLVASFFGAILGGTVPSIMPFLTEKLLPENYRHSLSNLLEITRPAAIITSPDFLDEVRLAAAGSSVKAVLTNDEINAFATPLVGGEINKLYGLRSRPEDIALLQHSSGTTGLQKGVALSHQAVFNQLDNYSRAIQLIPDDVIVSWLPLYHDMGLVAGFLMPVLLRIPLVLISPFDWVRSPVRLLKAVTKYNGTLSWLPNFAFNFCAQKIRKQDLEALDLSSWRAVINCSEPMYWNSHKQFHDRFQACGLQPGALATSYAMAENVFAVTQGGIASPVVVDTVDRRSLQHTKYVQPIMNVKPWGEPDLEKDEFNGQVVAKMLSAGRAIDGTHLRILAPDGSELDQRHIGEIAIQSDCMLTEYYNRPDLTQKSFFDGWYLTGDLGYMIDQELFVTGRIKDLIIVGGKNIYPQDLEMLAGQVEGIHPGRVVAFGIYNEKTGTEDVIIVAETDFPISDNLANEKFALQVEGLADQIRAKVTRGSDVALRHVHLVGRNWLVKTSSGKVARNANKNKYLASISSTTSI